MTSSSEPAAGSRPANARTEVMVRIAQDHLERLTRPRGSLRPHLRALGRSLSTSYRTLSARIVLAEEEGTAAEWLLDNEHVVREALEQVRESLPRGYYRTLPSLQSGFREWRPRVYAVARRVLEAAGRPIELEFCAPLLEAYQRVASLTIGELWAFPALLRLAVLEDLAKAAAEVARRSAGAAVTVEPEPEVEWAIRALRDLAAWDWKDFFEQTSRVERILRRDPVGAYPRMSFETRDHYRKVVEIVARRSQVDEETVARKALELATEAAGTKASDQALTGGSAERTAHIGTWLAAEGRTRLERAVDCRVPRRIRLGRRLAEHATGIYLAVVGVAWAAALTLPGVWLAFQGVKGWRLVLGLVLSSGPALGLALAVVNWLASLIFPPRALSRMDPELGVPEGGRTLVIMPVIVSRRDEIESLLARLEIHFLGNRDPALSFALVTDFADANTKTLPTDAGLLEVAQEGIRRLNLRHGRDGRKRFHLFHRERRWNPMEGKWMGWERKRGKLEELNQLLAGGPETSFAVEVDPPEDLEDVRYVLTLDADTRLPPGVGVELVATFAHPLNRAVIGPGGEVQAGYTVLQPRLDIEPSAVNESRFSRTFAGEAGLDLYTRAVSDVYQDLFGEAVFTGKGIYDVHAFSRCLRGRVPENRLLSHDLFEGVHGRVALVSDVVLFEDYPSNELLYARRIHRWVRGDWQLLPWLLPRVPSAFGDRIASDLSLLDRWKIADNLRRSLFLPSLTGLLVVAWLAFPLEAAAVATAGIAAVLGAPIVFGALGEVRWGLTGRVWRSAVASAVHNIRLEAVRWLLTLVAMAHLSLVELDAIGRTLYRLGISRRRLLEWTTAAHTARSAGGRLSAATAWRRMLRAPVLAVAVAGLVAVSAPASLPAAAPLLVLWFISPQVAVWTSQPVPRPTEELSDLDRRELRMVARRTWRFFEELVGPADHWLPPDHFQEQPSALMARRTSPTNVAMLLLSTLAAYDLGFLGIRDLVARTRQTLETLAGLERRRGHWLNWYDTKSLVPLEPQYISTVDSGNLAAALLVLRQGLAEARARSAPNPLRLQGIADTVAVLGTLANDGLVVGAGREDRWRGEDVVEELRALEEELRKRSDRPLEDRWRFLEALEERLVGTVEGIAAALEDRRRMPESGLVADLRAWVEHALAEARSSDEEMEEILPWLDLVTMPPILYQHAAPGTLLASTLDRLRRVLATPVSLEELPGLAERGRRLVRELGHALDEEHGLDGETASEARIDEAQSWNCEMLRVLEGAAARTREVVEELRELESRCSRFTDDMDFTYLYDRERDLFRIGHHVSSGEPDPNHYDLLASEARIASLVAIAKGDAPLEHWLRLGRPVIRVGGARVLLSWSGTMFEYLMPSLLLRTPPRTLLEESCRVAVKRQVTFGGRHGVPWGISESGFAELGIQGDYQYRAFGVPGLGLKRDLGERLVVAPYASLLALPVRPRRVMENLDRLRLLGALGRYGFFEAVDYGPTEGHRLHRPRIVYSYMAHHQGMILVAVANRLLSDVMVERMHADPRVAGHELLLYEQVPRGQPVRVRWGRSEASAAEPQALEEAPASARWEVPALGGLPRLVPLSNGVYTVLASSGGGGVSRWREIALTRHRHDSTLEAWGTWIYLRDMDSGDLWSPSLEPTGGEASECSVIFCPHCAEFRRRRDGLLARCFVAVAERHHAELRRVLVTNEGEQRRRLFVASYAEVVLGPEGEDRRHQAFSKLFVESEYRSEHRALLFRRRRRSPQEEPVVLGHSLVIGADPQPQLHWETDRGLFLGRGRDRRSPRALDEPREGFSGATGATLDPVFSLGCVVELEPGESAELTFLTAAGASEERVLGSLAALSSPRRIDWALERARSRSDAELRQLRIPASEFGELAEALSYLLAPAEGLRAGLQAAGPLEPMLWSQGISGDRPILLLRVTDAQEMGLVRKLLRGHAWWRSHRVGVDLVLLDEVSRGYERPLRGRLGRAATEIGRRARIRGPGTVVILSGEELGDARTELLAAARVVLETGTGSLAEQLARGEARRVPLPEFVPVPGAQPSAPEVAALERPSELLLDNGLGGFLPEARAGGGYGIFLEPGQRPPAPWINVLANPGFGCLVSESGAVCTWAGNSGEARLTPWHNDPVSDPTGEAVYLRDEETAEVWSPTPVPAPAARPYEIHHAPGRSIFRHRSHGLGQELELFVDPEAPVKLAVLRLRDLWQRPRRITATYQAEWVLGALRELTAPFIVSEVDSDGGALLARVLRGSLADREVAFLTSSRPLHGFTTDRTEWLGRGGNPSSPAGLRRIGLSGTVRPGLDPCAALQIHLDIAPGGTAEVHFVMGMGRDRDQALELLRRFRTPEELRACSARAKRAWARVLERITVETPDPAVDRMLNRWLPYQAVACRLWARTALYQSSGAYGFRDQLQDAANLAPIADPISREQILMAAGRQFEEGDVLHWWHPVGSLGDRIFGVRTRCSDDLLWLPWACARYVEVTGDSSILEERMPYLSAPELEADEVERFTSFESGGDEESIYHHCLRALERGMTWGPHGLPLIGSGDWNDGMNRLGLGGRGESVWLGWFLCAVLRDFAPLCEDSGEPERATALREQARRLAETLEEHAWDGAWYRRAYDDDGQPLGSAEGEECRIDLIAQAWAVLSGAADPRRAASAMASAKEHLLRRDEGLLLLLIPPFGHPGEGSASIDPGYIAAYPPGIRENGGQYTHGATWGAWAFTKLGDGDLAMELLHMLLPISKTATPEAVQRYRVEPYAVAADVYGAQPHTGRGGWTWYTGSAGWLWRFGIEAVLGLKRRADVLVIDPCIPRQWPGFRVELQEGEAVYEIRVENPEGVSRGLVRVEVDGRCIESGQLPLRDDGRRHRVVARMAAG